MNLTLFDLDNTLISGDSDFEWAQFLISRGVVDGPRHEARNLAFYDDYKAGVLDIEAFLAFQLEPLTRIERPTLDAWREEFMRERIAPLIGQAARDLVRQHLQDGDLCAMVTATNSFVTAPICRAFGVEHLIATIPAHDNGRFTGAARGMPAFREGKPVRVEAWLESLGLWWGAFARSTFYSDSHNDLPLLEKVTHPVAVDADETLRRHAQQHGWLQISLRV